MDAGGEVDRRDFFISHAGADQQWAQWIGQQLVDAGYTVELDVWDWAAGTNFVDSMRAALERAERVVAVYTDAYFVGRYAQAEHAAAFTSAKAGRIVPVRVEECEVPQLYAPLLRIELAGLDQDEARRRLLAGIAGPPGPPDQPVGFPGLPAHRPRGLAAVPPEGKVEFPRRRPLIWNVPARNPFFTGRDAFLITLDRRLRQAADGKGGPVAVVPLQGMSGVGKTQLAVEYAHRHSGDYQAVWWVNIDNLSLATTGLVDLAAALSLPTDGPPATVLRLLWAALGERTDWLLIYDNVDDPTMLADLRPPDRGRLLLTSRNPTLRHVADLVEVGEFDRAESIALLRRRCPALSDAQADQVAIAVGDLPLAVEQAGCFLTDTGLDVADYLHLLATQPAQAGLDDPTLDRHPGLVAVVTASRDRLHAANPLAAAMLDQLAFCAPEPLPLTPRRDRQAGGPSRFGVQVGDTAATAAVVRHITRLGLARQAGTSLQAHSLVQALLRTRLAPDGQARARRAAQQLVATAAPGDPNDPTCWPAYATLTPHIQALAGQEDSDAADLEPDEFRAMLLDVTRYLYVSGQSATGRHLAEAAYRRWSGALGPDHEQTLRAAFSLGACLDSSTEDRVRARTLNEDTLARYRRIFGDDHLNTLSAANNLAATLQSLGDLEAARTLFEDALARYRRIFGDDHPSTLQTAINLADCLTVSLRMGSDIDSAHNLASIHRDVASALALLEDTLGRCRRVLGDDHPDTLTAANFLALVLWRSGDPAVARALFGDALARCRRVFGDDHPRTLESARNLAVCQMDLIDMAHGLASIQGDLASTRALLEDTLGRCRRVLGDDHPDTLIVAYNLAICQTGHSLASKGDVASALALLEDTLGRCRRVFGDDHPHTRACAMALKLAMLGRTAETLDAVEETVGAYRSLAEIQPTSFHFKLLATGLIKLSLQLRQAGKNDEALSAVQEATNLLRKLADEQSQGLPGGVGENSEQAAEEVAHALGVEGVDISATAGLVRGKIGKVASSHTLFILSGALSILVAQFTAMNRLEDALVACDDTAALYERLKESRNVACEDELADALHLKAKILAETRRYSDALTVLEHAMENSQKDPKRATLLGDRAAWLSELGQFHVALVAIEESIEVHRRLEEETPGAYLSNLASSLETRASLLRTINRADDALASLADAIDIRRRSLDDVGGRPTITLATSLSKLALWLSQANRGAEAIGVGAEAIILYRGLSETDPASFTEHLVLTLSMVGGWASDSGEHRHAAERFAEAWQLAHDHDLWNLVASVTDLLIRSYATAPLETGESWTRVTRKEIPVWMWRSI